jgi:ABC-type branched-subunit amino acid transport system substrate-binding protein
MRRRSFNATATGVACAALVAIVVAGCGSSSSSEPGVTSSSVTFGSHQPLTGPAAPGYSEIAPASQAFFNYLNAQGGINGRKINLIYKDDEYNPAKTVNVVHELVLQDNVFGIFEGLGTPTHTKVVSFLNSSKVPDMFVASGCACWDNGTAQPYTFGWQPNYTIEGKILGQYIKQHFGGKKIGVFYQDDDFGTGGLTGIKDEVPASSIVSAQPYQPGGTNVAPQISAIKAAGAEVVVYFTVPIYTALGQLTSFTLGYKPQLVISNVGSDPTTVGGLLKTFSKGKAGTELIEGAITDGYLPSVSETSNPWIELFKKVHEKYDPSAPFDGNVEYGMANAYTLAQSLQLAGKSLTRQGLVNAVNTQGSKLQGPGLVPFRYSTTVHGGYSGVEMGQIRNGKVALFGGPLVTEPTAGSPITPYTGTQPPPPASGVSVP